MSESRWPAYYEITVEGVLGDRWAAWFEGLEIAAEGNRTILSGVVADQAALHGLLGTVRDLGLPLLSVCRRGDDGGAAGGGAA